MKIFIGNLISILIIVIVVSSCNNDSNNNNDRSMNNDSIKPLANEEERYNEIGFGLMDNESIGEIRLGIESKKIIELFGQPENKSKSEVQGADGEYHQTWKYIKKGLEFDMIGKQGDQVLNMITITSPCELKTKRNIGIGSTYEEVGNAYRKEINPEFSDTETIIAGSIYGGIVFTFQDTKVKSLFIGASAE
jgi:hypothetical protein